MTTKSKALYIASLILIFMAGYHYKHFEGTALLREYEHTITEQNKAHEREINYFMKRGK